MKIGIDVSRTADKMTGIERYAAELVLALAEIDRQNDYVLYPFFWHCFPANPRRAVNPRRPNFKIHQPAGFDEIKKKWEAGVVSKKELLGPDVDIVHGLFYAVPEEYQGKIVVTVHDVSFLKHPEFHTVANRDFCLARLEEIRKNADMVITISEFSRKELVEQAGIDPGKIRVIYEAAAEIFRPLTRADAFQKVSKNFGLEKEFILFAGSIEPRKNLSALIGALEIIRKNGKISPQLVLAGGQSWLSENLREKIKQLGLSYRVVFTGYVTDEELVALYNSAGVFVYPSIYEGFGLPPLEAMACGCPVITSNTSSLPEVVGSAAITVAPDDIRALAEAIEKVLTNPDLQNDLIKKGLAQSAGFSWAKTARATLDVYREVLENIPNLPEALIIGQDERGLSDGWYVLEKPTDFYFRWTKKKFTCYLRTPADAASRLFLTLTACSHYHNKDDDFQSLELLVNGEKVGRRTLRFNWHRYIFSFPAGPRRQFLKIEFVLNRVLPPAQICPDARQLGVMIGEVSLQSKTPVFTFEENQKLNWMELQDKEIVLQSLPTGTFQLDITTKCNIDPPCIMCYKNSATEEFNRLGDISPELYDKIKEAIKYPSALYICSSGEPLCCSKFWEILESARTDVVFNTNGLLLTEANSRRVLAGGKVKTISFSLDATTPGTYARIRGQDFQKVLQNIKTLVRLKKELNCQRPQIFASMVVMKLNAAEVMAFPDLAQEVGIEALEFPPVNLKENFQVSWEGQTYHKKDLALDLGEYQDLVNQATVKAEKMGLFVRKEFGN